MSFSKAYLLNLLAILNKMPVLKNLSGVFGCYGGLGSKKGQRRRVGYGQITLTLKEGTRLFNFNRMSLLWSFNDHPFYTKRSCEKIPNKVNIEDLWFFATGNAWAFPLILSFLWLGCLLHSLQNLFFLNI
jgi:hypothetical protein